MSKCSECGKEEPIQVLLIDIDSTKSFPICSDCLYKKMVKDGE